MAADHLTATKLSKPGTIDGLRERRHLRGRIKRAPGMEARLLELAQAHAAWGGLKSHQQLRQEGHRINQKRIERLYR